MKNIALARIDDRLIHGQVVTAWIKQYPINKILIIDDELSSKFPDEANLCSGGSCRY